MKQTKWFLIKEKNPKNKIDYRTQKLKSKETSKKREWYILILYTIIYVRKIFTIQTFKT